MDRRQFIGASVAAAVAAGLASCTGGTFTRKSSDSSAHTGAKMKLSFFPYELELAHTFTVASYSRKATPDVQVEIV